MMDRRGFLGASALTASAAALAACGTQKRDANSTSVLYWGLGAGDAVKDQKALAAFKKTDIGSKIDINVQQVPSNGNADMSQIITAVRGGTGPDVWWMDRFNATQMASLGLLEPIDDLIEKYEDDPEEFKKGWVNFSINELIYQKKLYGLPTSTDTRGIMYNKNVLQQNGIDLDMFNPKQHTLTMDEFNEINRKLTKKDGKGNILQLWVNPWTDQAWPYTWGFCVGAEAYDNDKSKMVLDSDKWKKVFTWYHDWAKELGYAAVDTFYATYQPPNAPPAQTAMFSQKLAMTITGPWQVSGNKKYAPNLPLDFTWLPTETEGGDHYTWAGGYSLVMPKGSSKSKAAWDFMKWYAGTEGQKVLMPLMGNSPTNRQCIREGGYDPDTQFFVDLLPTSYSRPPLPVGSLLWDTLASAMNSATIGSGSPEGIIANNQATVQPKMELFKDFKLPKQYGQPSPI